MKVGQITKYSNRFLKRLAKKAFHKQLRKTGNTKKYRGYAD